MTSWAAVVLAQPEDEQGPMVSRLPSFLHPVAGRPLVWHAVSSLAAHENAPEEVIVVGQPELVGDLFEGLPVPITVQRPLADGSSDEAVELPGSPVVMTYASAFLEAPAIRDLLAAADGSWLRDPVEGAIAATLDPADAAELLHLREPLGTASGALEPAAALAARSEAFRVRTRADLAEAQRRIRDQIVGNLMASGVTFLLPETVMVDLDVRIGRDSVIYPGVTLEGQTTIGEETVIGPGCRIIESWVGSGVEMKGWNYIANTSVRNRAILEPYVRRGFD